jgi:hypothetical protein
MCGICCWLRCGCCKEAVSPSQETNKKAPLTAIVSTPVLRAEVHEGQPNLSTTTLTNHHLLKLDLSGTFTGWIFDLE